MVIKTSYLSPLLWLRNKSCSSQQKILNEMVWYFILYYYYIINGILHGCLEVGNLSSRVEKYLTHTLRSLVNEIRVRHTKRNSSL